MTFEKQSAIAEEMLKEFQLQPSSDNYIDNEICLNCTSGRRSKKTKAQRLLYDKRLRLFYFLTGCVLSENKKQIEKWGIQKRTPFEWMAYLTEEVGELSNAISEQCYRDGDRLEVFNEAIQAATLALKIAEMYFWEEKKARLIAAKEKGLNK